MHLSYHDEHALGHEHLCFVKPSGTVCLTSSRRAGKRHGGELCARRAMLDQSVCRFVAFPMIEIPLTRVIGWRCQLH